MKNIMLTVLAVLLSCTLTGCAAGAGSSTDENAENQSAGESAAEEKEEEERTAEDQGSADGKTELTILAAASLTDVCSELEQLYEEKHPDTELVFSYGASGALQTQIEEGAPADIFFSAAMKQMNALKDEGLMVDESITELLENKIVLVVPKGADSRISAFEDIATDKVRMVGLGEPESVPAGQYAEQVFDSLGIKEAAKEKANYGSDVRTVLSWVEEQTVDCGVVYATDAYGSEKAEIAAEAPEGSCEKVIYPVGIVAASEDPEAAKGLISFLSSDEALSVFESYGFSKAE